MAKDTSAVSNAYSWQSAGRFSFLVCLATVTGSKFTAICLVMTGDGVELRLRRKFELVFNCIRIVAVGPGSSRDVSGLLMPMVVLSARAQAAL